MSPARFLFLAVAFTVTTATSGVLVLAACSSTAASDHQPDDDASNRKDGEAVIPTDGGIYDGATPPGPDPTCPSYCDLVMGSCKDDHAQYASRAECIEICGRLPLGDAGDTTTDTIACREYYAGSPAQTDAFTYCLAAGPFGGGICGDRCAIFCELAIDACPPKSATSPYNSYSDCQTACIGFAYKDGGVDGGGEPPNGPADGNTLNCRLFHLRAAVHDGTGCTSLGQDSGSCR